MDVGTIFVTLAVLVLANGAVLANIQRDLPDVLRPSSIRWQIATLLVAAGGTIFAFGHALPLPLLVTSANSALIAGLAFYHWSIQTFYGERPTATEAVIVVLVGLCIYWFSAVQPNFTLRLVLVSVLWVVLLGRSAWTLHRNRAADPSRSRRMLLVIYGILLAFIVVRAGLYARAGLPAVFSVASDTTTINIASPVIMSLLPVIGTTTFALMCVDRMRRELQTVAATDYLTGLANRRMLDERGEAFLAQARRGGSTFAAVIFDLDGFKAVNDTHGHAVGDAVLVHAARGVREGARQGDVVVRSGGEEFVLLLHAAGSAGAVAAAERIRAAIAARPYRAGDVYIPVTVSAGVAAHRPDDRDFDTLLRRADRALYRAKTAGRNRVEVEE